MEIGIWEVGDVSKDIEDVEWDSNSESSVTCPKSKRKGLYVDDFFVRGI
jgi:hypothetical protein